jgi:hypothetical protein
LKKAPLFTKKHTPTRRYADTILLLSFLLTVLTPRMS